MSDEDTDDIRAIEALIARQFQSLCWTPEMPADWAAFAADFLPGAPLVPSARPVQPQSVGSFVDRMRGLSTGALHTFYERVLGTRVCVFGNVAVAVAAVENTENGAETNRGVEMLLLVKDGGEWKIAAQAWDKATPERPVPARLAGAAR